MIRINQTPSSPNLSSSKLNESKVDNTQSRITNSTLALLPKKDSFIQTVSMQSQFASSDESIIAFANDEELSDDQIQSRIENVLKGVQHVPVSLHDIEPNRHEIVLKAISQKTDIQSLNLSICEVPSNIENTIIDIILSIVENNKDLQFIPELYLGEKSLSFDQIERLFKKLSDNNIKVHTLSIHSIKFGDAGVEHLTENWAEELKNVYLKYVDVTEDGAKCLFQKLQNLPFEKLSISGNKIPRSLLSYDGMLVKDGQPINKNNKAITLTINGKQYYQGKIEMS